MARADSETNPEVQNADEVEVRDTDIAFSCPSCGKNLVIDYRGAGLEIKCTQCGKCAAKCPAKVITTPV